MAVPAEKFAVSDFLAWESTQTTRHELYSGEVFAMVGARRVHGLIALNLASMLKSALKGTRYRAFIESMKLQVADDKVFYPDVFVTCDAADLTTDMVFRQPCLIAEVLSDSTQVLDRGLKFAAYRQIDSLREYVLIEPETRRIEVFRRNERENFELHDQTGHAELALESVGLRLSMEDLLDGVQPEAA
jgi:Uma2 family endonuclease